MEAVESERRELKPSCSPPASPLQPTNPVHPTKLPAISPDGRSNAEEIVSEKKLQQLVELQRRRVAERNSAQETAAVEAYQRRQCTQRQASCICGRTGKMVTHREVRRAQQKVTKAVPTRVSTAVSEEWQDSVL